MLRNALEPVVVGLVGDLHHHLAEAEGLDDILALLVLQVCALLYIVGLTVGIGSRHALGPVAGHLDLGVAGQSVGHGRQVGTGILRHTDGGLYVHQLAVLPRHLLAVLVAGPHLLSKLVDDPLGVTLFLLHGLTDRLLVRLKEGLTTGLMALLTNKGFSVACVVLHDLGEGHTLAVGIRISLALLDGDLHASRAGLGLAAATDLEGAEVCGGGVVLDLAVAGDVNAVLLVAITVVIAAREPGDKSD